MASPKRSTKSQKELQKLSHSIGGFIRYWGFRRIHGSVWTQLYLSSTPLSCKDLTQNLGVSKALVSPALEELCQYKLIHEVASPNEKTKLYSADPNTTAVIKNILQTREAKMLTQIVQDFSHFQKSHPPDLDPVRIKSLGDMILSANMMLNIMLAQTDLFDLPTEFDGE